MLLNLHTGILYYLIHIHIHLSIFTILLLDLAILLIIHVFLLLKNFNANWLVFRLSYIPQIREELTFILAPSVISNINVF